MPYLSYALTLLLSSTLIFAVQPMVTRMVQPMLGGTPAVWNTSLVFFQAFLLLGYFYAHVTTRWLGPRRQAILHVALLATALLFLPISFSPPSDPATLHRPSLWLLGALLGGIGMPFLLLSASAPLLQKWFSTFDHPHAKDPYHLYAASNLGSLTALLAYPLLVEPRLGLQGQSLYWTAAFLLLIAAFALCAALLWRQSPAPSPDSDRSPAESTNLLWSRRLRWTLWAFIPSALMLAATTHITTDLASLPLLWIPPLAIYLLSFIITFARRKLIANHLWWVFVPLAVLLLFSTFAFDAINLPFGAEIILHLATLLIISLAFHGALADDRPHTEHLTEFYIWMSLGGVLGGSFVALASPLLFNPPLEYPLLLVFVCAIFPATFYRRLKLTWILTAAAIIATFFYARPSEHELLVERSFFAVHRVQRAISNEDIHLLYHGNTSHSAQSHDPELRTTPLTYYHPLSPIADVFDVINRRDSTLPVAVVGLGAGTLSTYAVDTRRMDFFEIDPTVEEIARNPKYFTFLPDCGDSCHVILGDGRLQLQRAPDHHYELIVLDAYSSSSIPVHLMTQEALELFINKLHPEGILAFHISNRHLDLEAPVAALAEALGLTARARIDDVEEDHPYYELYANSSHWVVMARSPEALREISFDPQWKLLPPSEDTPPWTDDFVDILSTLR